MKCRISFDGVCWVFFSPYGLRSYRLTFAEVLADMDAHIRFLKRNGIVSDGEGR